MGYHRVTAQVFFILVVGLLGVASLVAEEGEVPSNFGWQELALTWDNDAIWDEDDGYTNGVMLSLGSDLLPSFADGPLGSTIGNLLNEVPVLDRPGGKRHLLLSLNHRIYTPADLSVREPPANSHPYSAQLYLGLAASRISPRRFDAWTFHAGIMGPSALGREVQSGIHEIIGAREPQGWGSQIGHGVLLNLTYTRRQRWWSWRDEDSAFAADLLAGFELAVGSLTTNGSARLSLRFGPHVPQDYFMPEAFLGETRLGAWSVADDNRWFIYGLIGFDMTMVAYAAQWDGRFGEALKLDRRAGHLRLHAGVQLGYGRFGSGFVATLPSIPWEDVYDRRWDGYASMTMWYRF